MVRSSLAPIAAAAALIAAAVSIAQADPRPGAAPTHVARGTVGADTLWAMPGRNRISSGRGADTVWIREGYGTVNCGTGNDLVDVSRKVRRYWHLRNCETIR